MDAMMAENEPNAASGGGASHDDAAQLTRVALIWRLIVFQLKLVMDGLRDILLSPVSFVVVLVGLIAGGDTPDRYWRQLMRFGRRTDHWINLFDGREGGADALIEPIERMMTEDPRHRSWLARVERFFERLSMRAPPS